MSDRSERPGLAAEHVTGFAGSPAPGEPATGTDPDADGENAAGLEGTDVAQAFEEAVLDVRPAGGEATSEVVAADSESPTIEELVSELETAVSERDEYLALARSRQAELENYRKQVMKRQAEHLEQAAAGLAEKLLPVLDAFDAAVLHGLDDLAPMQAQLVSVLQREGLVRVDPAGGPFDPAEADAVAHEAGDGEGGAPVVAETLRSGWRWQGRLLRPAMVRVRG